jgi:hypothetical protein
MKNFTKIIGLFIALTASSAQAVPTLFFDGAIDYNANDSKLVVSAALTDTVDITPAPTLLGSTMVFSALFDNVENLSGGCFFCVSSTKGNFVGNGLVDDLTILDGDGITVLLTAQFASLSLEGTNGSNRGEVIGLLNATGGSLMSMFDGSDLFALQLDLNTSFSSTMYRSDFSGMVDGNIEGRSVPEPSLLALLGIGMLVAGFARKTKI